MVRCSKCHDIFTIYPPDFDSKSDTKSQISKRNESEVESEPDSGQSILDDFFDIRKKYGSAASDDKTSDDNTVDGITSIRDFEEEEADSDS